MYDIVKKYMFEATYWIIAIVYDKSKNIVKIVSYSLSKNDLQLENSNDKILSGEIKINTSWGHFSTGTFTPDGEYYYNKF